MRRRGTFVHRHAVLHDNASGRLYTPLAHLSPTQGRFEVWDSPLSEAGVLGPGDSLEQPPSEQPPVDQALAYVGMTPAPLAMIPIEDLLGVEEAPNLPGTTDQHPNWRRRLPGTVDSMLDTPAVQARTSLLNQTRQAPERQE